MVRSRITGPEPRAALLYRRARRSARTPSFSSAALGLNLKQFYGQTENCALTAAQRDGAVRLHTVGRPLPGVEIRIGDSGEILMRAASVFDGYTGDAEATAQRAGRWLAAYRRCRLSGGGRPARRARAA